MPALRATEPPWLVCEYTCIRLSAAASSSTTCRLLSVEPSLMMMIHNAFYCLPNIFFGVIDRYDNTDFYFFIFHKFCVWLLYCCLFLRSFKERDWLGFCKAPHILFLFFRCSCFRWHMHSCLPPSFGRTVGGLPPVLV